MDWLSRPPADIKRVFRDKPVAIIGATLGLFGTVLGQAAWLPVIRALGMQPWWGGTLGVGNANTVFDASGNLVNSQVKTQLEHFLAGFTAFVAAVAPSEGLDLPHQEVEGGRHRSPDL